MSVLEFAEMAISAGGMSSYSICGSPAVGASTHGVVPQGVLQVLPGYGRTVGKMLVSDPTVRKVDITVSSPLYRWSDLGQIVIRQEQRPDGPSAALSARTSPHTQQSSVARHP